MLSNLDYISMGFTRNFISWIFGSSRLFLIQHTTHTNRPYHRKWNNNLSIFPFGSNFHQSPQTIVTNTAAFEQSKTTTLLKYKSTRFNSKSIFYCWTKSLNVIIKVSLFEPFLYYFIVFQIVYTSLQHWNEAKTVVVIK